MRRLQASSPPRPPPPTLTTTTTSITLCLFQLILAQGLFHLTHADALLTHADEWERGERGTWERAWEGPFVPPRGHSDIGGEREEEEGGEWVVEEESVAPSPSLHSSPPSGERRAVGEIWWKVVAPDDPARGAEPAKWDGWPILHQHYPLPLPLPRLPNDYEVLQETWVEDAVT